MSVKRPGTDSIVTELWYEWHDDEWMKARETRNNFTSPMNIYECHLGSWKRPDEEESFYSYRELADMLVPYVKEMGYTHIEFLPVMEHPLDASWGYQVTGFYAPTSRYGSAHGLKHLIEEFHKEGIGVILDWVPGHFCPDDHGLRDFNGDKLYESIVHPDWGTYKFDFGRPQVRSFLLSNAMYWLDEYHADGLRVDGVTSMLYLNFGISDKSKMRFNKDGGETDLEAVEFLKEFTFHDYREFRDDRRVDLIASDRCQTSPLEFIVHIVTGRDAEKIRFFHVSAVRKTDSERFALPDIGKCLLAPADAQIDFVRACNLSPGNIHSVDFAVCVVCCHDQNRHREYSLLDTKIFLH